MSPMPLTEFCTIGLAAIMLAAGVVNPRSASWASQGLLPVLKAVGTNTVMYPWLHSLACAGCIP